MDIERETVALRRIARALIADPAAVDDLVQDTWLAALRRPPADGRPVRPWLARVLRNRAYDNRQTTRRSRAREAAADPPAEIPSGEQFQVSRQLLEEIAELPATDRELVMLRYWEGLTAAECAARLCRPSSTVRTQLQRAIARLRDRLDRWRGGRASWMAALMPLVRAPGPVPVGAGTIGAKTLTAGGVMAATVLWLAAANTQGCGVTSELAGTSAVDDPEPTPAKSKNVMAASSEGRTPTAARRADVGTRDKLPEPKGMHPKLAAARALRDVEEPLSECGDPDSPGATRLALAIRYYPDGRALFESVEFSDTHGLSAATLDCVRQTLLARELDMPPIEPFSDEPVVAGPRMDVRFDDQGRAELRGVSRGPAMHLFTATKRGEDLDEAVAACGPGTTQLQLTFEPDTGGLSVVEALPPWASTERGACVAAAVLATVRRGRPFEPQAEADRHMRCTFGIDRDEPGRYDCRRLGPDGRYVDVD